MPTEAEQKRCIINVAFGSDYEQKQVRLMDSLADKFDGSLLFYRSESSIGAPPHTENPYAFKVFAFKKAAQEGFLQILWLDANVRVDGSLSPVWDAIEKDGYYFIGPNGIVGEWSSDAALNAFNISREDALKIPEISGCVVGLDLEKRISQKFFEHWKLAMLDGLFKGDWRNDHNQVSLDNRVKGHRHDQTIASLLAHSLEMTNFNSNVLWYESSNIPKPETTVFVKT